MPGELLPRQPVDRYHLDVLAADPRLDSADEVFGREQIVEVDRDLWARDRMIVARYAPMDVLQQPDPYRIVVPERSRSRSTRKSWPKTFSKPSIRGVEAIHGLSCRHRPRPRLAFEHPPLYLLLRLCRRQICEGQVILAFEVRPSAVNCCRRSSSISRVTESGKAPQSG